jgi:hypothetical protein
VFLDREIAAWPKPTIALDRLLAALVEVEKVKAGANFNNTPPRIIFAMVPSVLVLIDGEPILRDVEGFPIKRVVNTPFVVLLDPADNKYYLTGDALWFVAAEVKGPWQPLESPPAPVAAAAKKIAEAEVPTQVQPATLKAETVPQIVVATEPRTDRRRWPPSIAEFKTFIINQCIILNYAPTPRCGQNILKTTEPISCRISAKGVPSRGRSASCSSNLSILVSRRSTAVSVINQCIILNYAPTPRCGQNILKTTEPISCRISAKGVPSRGRSASCSSNLSILVSRRSTAVSY